MNVRAWVLAATLLAAPTGALAQAATDAPAKALLPTAVLGSAINVKDLEAEREWYAKMLGLDVLFTFPPQGQGPLREYVMGYKGPNTGGHIVLNKEDRGPGVNNFGRLVLAAPDAKALAMHLFSKGVTTKEILPGSVYIIVDPEGNLIELYTKK